MGTSKLQASWIVCIWDHPHAYGDKAVKAVPTQVIAGSSPRVWGQVKASFSRYSAIGIIPTRMGTRRYIAHHERCCEDHPHAYGDKYPLVNQIFPLGGSSPRVWGQVKACAPHILFTGIIPTRMGTRSRHKGSDKAKKDHPHAYGDKLIGTPKYHSPSGSSPRVWGQVVSKFCSRIFMRIIPTRMGTSRHPAQ